MLVGGWLLLRQPTPAAAPAGSLFRMESPPRPKQAAITLAWAGDLTPGSKYGLPGGEGREQLRQARPLLQKADLTMANLEGTLTKRGIDKCSDSSGSCFSFSAPPRYARGLQWSGIDIANLANNHSLDRGPQGLRDTTASLRKEGIASTGTPGKITYLTKQRLKIAIVGFAPYSWVNNLTDLKTAQRLVRKASKASDITWVAIHAGAEGAGQTRTPRGRESSFGEDRGNTRRFVREVIQAGADLVTGSGPHVVRGMEMYKGRLIAYSTGNFAGWRNFELGGTLSESAVLRVQLDSQGRLIGGKWHPLLLRGPGVPTPDPSRRSAQTANQAGRKDFGAKAVLVKTNSELKLPRP